MINRTKVKSVFKFITISLTLVFIVFTAVACSKNGGSLEYEMNDDGKSYKVTGIGKYRGSNVVIPDEYKGFPVTAIGESAFEDCKGIKSVEISDSVEKIESWAFWDCPDLTSIKFGAGLKTISFEFGGSIAEGCKKLKSLSVDENNENFYSSGNCVIETHSKKVVLGCKSSIIPDDEGIKIIGEYAFARCYGLDYVDIPSSVTTIERSAFNGSYDLKEISIPSSVTYIASYAFSGTGFSEFVVPDGIKVISEGLFSECKYLTEITIRGNVKKIEKNALGNCKNLAQIKYSGTPSDWNKVEKASGWKQTNIDITYY